MEQHQQQPKTSEEWFALVEEQKTSGLSQIEFCKQKNLIICRFGYYSKKYRDLHKNLAENEAPTFNQVMVPKSSPSNEIKIELPNGVKCQLRADICPDQLRKMMSVLLTC